jgi:hypothetical protein
MNKPELVERVALAIEEAIQPMYLLQGYKRAAATAAIEELGVERLAAALTEARELLLERKQGSPARSASHNARLVIDEALSSLSKGRG